MGFFKFSFLVIIAAVVLNRIPGWFQGEQKVPPVVGYVAPGWEHVRDVYRQLFEDGDDKGSSFCVYHKGKPVVDLRGGFANEKELWPWQEDTITRLFSTTKGLSAMVIGVLVDRGLIRYDDLVTKYWPEFGVHGKEKTTVDMLIGHQAGLLVLTDESYTIWDEINDMEKVGRLLAAEKPKWEIGTGVGYHALTIGMYMDQLVRRVDQKHRSLAQFFHEEIAEPFGIDIQYGLKNSDFYRAAVIESFPLKLKNLASPEFRTFVTAIFYMMLGSPPLWSETMEVFDVKEITPFFTRLRPDVNHIANPSILAHGNAPALAKLYGILANGGSSNGKKLMSPATIELQTQGLMSGIDKVNNLQVTYGRGYNIYQSPRNTPMFGTPGMGGQMGYADPANKLAIGFTSNYMSMTGLRDHRYIPLEQAIYKCLDNVE